MSYRQQFLQLLFLLVLSRAFLLLADTPILPEIKIGGIYGLSGPLAVMSYDVRDAALLALEDAERGTNLKFHLLVEDHHYDPRTAVAAFQKLIDIDGVSFVQVISTGPAMAIKPMAIKRGVFQLSLTPHPDILKDAPLSVNSSNNIVSDAKVLASAVAKTSAKKIACISVQNEWAQRFQSEFLSALKEFTNADIVSLEHQVGDVDFRSHITRLLQAKPGVFVINSIGVAPALIMKQLRIMKFEGAVYQNNGFILSNESVDLVRKEGLHGFWYEAYPEAPDAFKESFRKRFGREPGDYVQLSYLEMELFAKAISKVGTNLHKVAAFMRGAGEFHGKYQNITISPDGDMRMPLLVKKWE